MSALVVTDVTATTGSAVIADTIYTAKQASDTSITPFETVLAQTTTNSTTETVPETVPEGVAMKVVATEGSGGSATVATTTKLDNIFKAAADKYNISYDFLVAVAKAESDFDYNCVSSAGAKGIMQLMPDEVKDKGVTDVFNPEQNIFAAAQILAGHLKTYNGDYTLAAAAYNAGSGAVKKYGGVPPYTETQNYVKKIAKFMKEGVSVPDKDAVVTKDYSGYESGKSSTSSGTTSSGTTSSGVSSSGSVASESTVSFDQGVMATEADYSKVRVTVGSGDDAVTMTYGAYQKYKELGTLGVG